MAIDSSPPASSDAGDPNSAATVSMVDGAGLADATADARPDPGAADAFTASPDGAGACGQIEFEPDFQGSPVVRGGDGFFAPTASSTNVVYAAEGGGVRAEITFAMTSGQPTTWNLSVNGTGNAMLTSTLETPCTSSTLAVGHDGRVFTAAVDQVTLASNVQCPNAQVAVQSFDSSAMVLQSKDVAVSNLTVYAAAARPQQGVVVALTPLAGTSALGLVIAFDASLAETARWTAPTGVALLGLALLKDGSVVVVGTTNTASGTTNSASGFRVWLDVLDGSALTPRWTSPRLVGAGNQASVDVTPAGNIVVAGVTPPPFSDSTSTPGTFWIQEFDATGTPLWQTAPSISILIQRSVLVAAQSDGSILVSGGLVLRPCP
jgi:hypothetical protein